MVGSYSSDIEENFSLLTSILASISSVTAFLSEVIVNMNSQ